MGLWTSSIGIVNTLGLRACDFVSQELRASEDPEFGLSTEEHSSQ